MDPPDGDAIDLGTTAIALNFERGADLPSTMRKELGKHGGRLLAGRGRLTRASSTGIVTGCRGLSPRRTYPRPPAPLH